MLTKIQKKELRCDGENAVHKIEKKHSKQQPVTAPPNDSMTLLNDSKFQA